MPHSHGARRRVGRGTRAVDRPAGGQSQADRGGEDEHEGDRSPRKRPARRQWNPLGELGERHVRLDEQGAEGDDEEAAQEGSTEGRHQAGGHVGREGRRAAQPNHRAEGGDRAQPSDCGARQEPGRRQIEGDDPVRIEHRRDGREREGERAEHDTLGPGARRDARRAGDERGDDEHADPERLSGESDGGRQGRSEGSGSHCDSSTTMRQPCGSASLGAGSSPPCRSTIQRAMARPRPAAAVARDERAWSDAVEALEDPLGLARRDARAFVDAPRARA